MPDRRPQAMLLPGAVLPAEIAYAGLIPALGDGVEAVAKDLELYAHDAPPAGYSLAGEVAALERAADAAGFDRFHLVGYSAGGAVSIAFAAERAGRLLSLALLEPAWTGNRGLSDEEAAARAEVDRIMSLPPAERMEAFVRCQLRPGVEPPPPPPGPPPPWMARRPAGLAAVTRAFKAHDLPEDRLRRFERPVLYALGELSNPSMYRRPAERLARVFPDFSLEVYEGRHHFDPPHRAQPELLAEALLRLWRRSV